MSSGFVTESELEAKRKARQEEWEKVRKPEEPKEAPEEEYDGRSLFERLEEQRQKKQFDWDEEHKFKNQIRGLNDEEVDFLDKVDDFRSVWEKKRLDEDKKELEEYQKRQSELMEKQAEERLKKERKIPEVRKVTNTGKSSQMKLLAGAVKRKSSESCKEGTETVETKKRKDDGDTAVEAKKDNENGDGGKLTDRQSSVGSTGSGALLGLGEYGSDSGSDSDND